MKVPLTLRYAVTGSMVSLGAPLGWLALRCATGEAEPTLWDELRTHAALYAYQLCGSLVSFTAFGALMGRAAEQLRRVDAYHAEQALQDALTGLPNRRAFEESLATECARAERTRRPLALIAVDLDRFKDINDEHGHAAGDRALAHAAAVLRSSVRAGDIACRTGGEEFAVLCPEADVREAAAMAERIREHLALRRAPGPAGQRPITASFGVAQWHQGEQPSAFFERADAQLYIAKRTGRNRVQATATTG